MTINNLTLAADNYNLENGDTSWFEDTANGIAAVAGSTVNGAINSLGYIGNAISNTLVSEGEQTKFDSVDTFDALRGVGLDGAAQYYNRHRQGVDALGMVVGGLIPGTVGIKAISFAAGKLPMLETLGMNISGLEKLRLAAKEAATAEGQLFRPMRAATLKAVASGVAVNSIEALGYEIAALSTTIKSPVYDDLTAGEMTQNILTFGVVGGGVVGGAFSAAKTYYGVVKATKMQALGKTVIESGHEGLRASDNILRARVSGAHETDINAEILRFTAEDGGITPAVGELMKKMPEDAYVNTFGGSSKITRLADIDKKLETVLLDGVETQQAKTPHSIIDLETGARYDDIKNVVGNIGDLVSKNSPVPMIDTRFGYAEIRDAAGKLLEKIYSKPLAEANLHEAQVAYISTAAKPLAKEIKSSDIPAMEKLLQNWEGSAVAVDGDPLRSFGEVKSMLRSEKQKLITAQMQKGATMEVASRIANVPENWSVDSPLWKIPASEEAWKREALTPRYAAIHYERDARAMLMNKDSAEAIRYMEAIATIDSQGREQAANAARGLLGLDTTGSSYASEFEVIKPLMNTVGTASEAAGFISSANGSLGSAMSWAQNSGRMVQNATTKLRSEALAALHPVVEPLKKTELLKTETIQLINKLRLTDAKYVMLPGESAAIRLDAALLRNGAKDGLDAGIDSIKNPLEIKLSPEVAEFLRTHSEINLNKYRKPSSMLATSHGYTDVLTHEKYPDLLPVYVPGIDMQRYKHFVLVRQSPDLAGAGSHVSTIVAPSAEALADKIKLAQDAIVAGGERLDSYKFITKTGTDDYYKALGEYQYARGINESRVDNTLRRAGVLGEMRPTLGDAAFDDMMKDFESWHTRMAARTVRDISETQYAEVFQQLRAAGSGLMELEKTVARTPTKAALEATKNPYLDVIKTSLNLSTFDEYKHWALANRFVENTGSNIAHNVKQVGEGFLDLITKRGGVSKLSEADMLEHTAALQDMSERLGMPVPFAPAAKHVYADQIAASPVISSFVAKSNGLLSLYALGLDFFQHINNLVGMAVGQNAEMASVLGAIAKKDATVAGKLAMVEVPGGGGSIISAAKLNARTMRRFFGGGEVWENGAWTHKTGKELLAGYESEGLVMTELNNFRNTIDNLSISGGEQAAELSNRFYKAAESFGDKGREILGGNFIEKMTRFVAADAMRQITDHGLAQGVIKSEAEAKMYWNTAVNRIQGNYVASQRPVVFQGAMGQAVGLFMTYQVNLMQQLFRYAGSGDKVGVGMLLGTQTALYGMQGLPGWNWINTHIIADAGGNINHTDMYATVNNAMSKQAADWTLYGAASNGLGLFSPELKFNLYTRGDINPRTLTVLPTSMTDTILYKSTLGFVGNLMNTAKNINAGAPLDQAFYQALQHQGINRPLAGAGAILAGGTYTADGKLIAPIEHQLDTHLLGNLVRLAGGKPLDDAIAADAVFRTGLYSAVDKEKRNQLAIAVRLEAADGKIDPDKWEEFALRYAKTGGDHANFRRFAIEKLRDQEQGIVERSAKKFREPLMQNLLATIGGDEPNFEPAGRNFIQPSVESEQQ